MQKTETFFLEQMERKQQMEEYVQILNQVHSHLSKETFYFIENEYINFYDTNWWIHMYSKATYYRMKHSALDEFFESILNFWSEQEFLMLLK